MLNPYYKSAALFVITESLYFIPLKFYRIYPPDTHVNYLVAIIRVVPPVAMCIFPFKAFVC